MPLLEKKDFLLVHEYEWVWWELDKTSDCGNENEHIPRSGPVVVRLTTYRFAYTSSTENRSSLVAYFRTKYRVRTS